MAKSVLDQLRERIERGDVSRYRIARDTGVDQAALSRFVHGQTGLNVMTAETLADYFGMRLVLQPKRAHKRKRG